jgi:pSer/pThr/pTyr-binding forkhead associated (FHA) protein
MIVIPMPVVRCQKCSQAYDIPPAIAVKLPTSIATCACGCLLAGDKTAILARLLETGNVRELDLAEYRIDAPAPAPSPSAESAAERSDIAGTRSIRVVAKGSDESVNTVFAVGSDPLWIGRKGCHIEMDDADLSIRHCSIERRGGDLFVVDADSHTGTYLDGEAVAESLITPGTHLLRVGSALVCVELTEEPGLPVTAIELRPDAVLEASPLLMKKLVERGARGVAGTKRRYLTCIEGPLKGKEFEIPETGLTIGREADVRVADEYLSRKHFAIVPEEDGTLRVRDLGSRNGTFLNTLPARNTKVHPGDEIRAGVNRFQIVER